MNKYMFSLLSVFSRVVTYYCHTVRLSNASWLNVCVRVYVCLRVSVCLRPSTAKALSFEGQINDVISGKGVFSSAKFHHCYFSMKHRAFLNGHFIMFTHQKRAKLDLTSLMCVSLSNYEASSYHYQTSASFRATLWAVLLPASALTRGVAF